MSLGVGIDVGSSSVTIAGVRKSGGSLSLEFYRHLELDEVVPEGDPTAGRISQAVAQALNEAGFRPRNIQIGVSGRDAIIRYSHLPPMPDWRLALLMQFEIADVAERTGEPLSADYSVLQSSASGNLVLVALAKDARVGEAVEAFGKSGIEVAGAVPQPVATADCFRFLGDDADRDLTLVLDIGDTSTEVALIDEGELIFARSVAQGGSTFTERLEDELGISREDAIQIKHSGRAPKGQDLESLLRVPVNQMASMVSASVDFAKRQLRRPNLNLERVVVAGGSAHVPGLVEAIGRATDCPAEIFDPLADLDRGKADRESKEHADVAGPQGATALGLAFSAVLPTANRLNLLPNAVKERLQFRHRTVWLYMSAAVLVASLLVSFAIGAWGYSSESGRQDDLRAVNKAIGKRLSAHEERKASNDKRDADIRALANRARPGFHLAALLRTLGDVLPTEISIVEGSLVEDDGSGGVFHFEFQGLADDAQGQGVAAMRALKSALEKDPHIALVTLIPQGPEGNARRFRLTVEPKGNPSANTEEGE